MQVITNLLVTVFAIICLPFVLAMFILWCVAIAIGLPLRYIGPLDKPCWKFAQTIIDFQNRILDLMADH